MIAIGILLNILGLGTFCRALFGLATNALPTFFGLTVGLYAIKLEQIQSVLPSSVWLRVPSCWCLGNSSSRYYARQFSALRSL